MMRLARRIGSVIALMLACLWTVASQAHFTDRLTPDIAAGVHRSTTTLHEAFWFLSLSVNQVSNKQQMFKYSNCDLFRLTEQIEHLFGSLGMLTALFLWIPRTRTLGLLMAILVTLAGRVYPQVLIEDPNEPHLGGAIASAAVAGIAALLIGS